MSALDSGTSPCSEVRKGLQCRAAPKFVPHGCTCLSADAWHLPGKMHDIIVPRSLNVEGSLRRQFERRPCFRIRSALFMHWG